MEYVSSHNSEYNKETTIIIHTVIIIMIRLHNLLTIHKLLIQVIIESLTTQKDKLSKNMQTLTFKVIYFVLVSIKDKMSKCFK